MTFVLMPFENEAKYTEMQQKIHDMQPSDIKKTNTVDKDFLSYLKNENVVWYSHLCSTTESISLLERTANVWRKSKETFQMICDCYEEWKKTACNKEILKHYEESGEIQ